MSQEILTTEKERMIEESADKLAWLFVEMIDEKYKRKNKKSKNNDK